MATGNGAALTAIGHAPRTIVTTVRSRSYAP
jgi:hypothetical protein